MTGLAEGRGDSGINSLGEMGGDFVPKGRIPTEVPEVDAEKGFLRSDLRKEGNAGTGREAVEHLARAPTEVLESFVIDLSIVGLRSERDVADIGLIFSGNGLKVAEGGGDFVGRGDESASGRG